MNQDYLPPIHREDGSRPNHDDFRIGKVPLWPFTLIPRSFDARPLDGIPRKIAGTSNFWVRNYYPYEECFSDTLPGPDWSPKPMGKKDVSHGWQLTLVPTKIFGKTFNLPYFSISFKNNLHFRAGLARLSDDYSKEEQKTYWYSKLFAFGFGKLKE